MTGTTPEKNRVHPPPLCDSAMLTLRRQASWRRRSLLPAVTAWAQTPITIFGNAVPQNPVIADSAVTLGVKFYSTQAGTITGSRSYRGHTDPSGYTVELFSSSGTLLGSARGKDTDAGRTTSNSLDEC